MKPKKNPQELQDEKEAKKRRALIKQREFLKNNTKAVTRLIDHVSTQQRL